MSVGGHRDRIDRWKAVTAESMVVGLVGVIAKAVTPVSVIVAVVGLFVSPTLVLAGAAVAVLGLAVWWSAARRLAVRGGSTTGRLMWAIWRVPTWTFLADLFDAF